MDYHLTDLGILQGGSYTKAAGLNDLGEVVGWGDGSDRNDRAFRYQNGSLVDMGDFGGGETHAVAVNSSGDVVGTYAGGGFIFSQGQFTFLGALADGSTVGDLTSINDNGAVVGSLITAAGFKHAMSYANGLATDLGTLGGTVSFATGINAQGDIVGASTTADYPSGEAFLYKNGVMTGLGTGGGAFSIAYGVNMSDEAVGSFDAGDDDQHACIFANGGIVNLGVGAGSVANAINDSGAVVGFGAAGGFVYQGGSLFNLSNQLDSSGAGYFIDSATGISTDGTICGWATAPDGSYHAVLLSPVPEPAAIVGLALGAAALAARKRRGV